MSQLRNKNFTEFKRLVEKAGGEVTGYRVGTKHFLVYARTAKGKPFNITLSKAPMPAGYVEFYTRQRIRAADRNHGGYGNHRGRKT